MGKGIKKEIDLSELPRWVNDGSGKAKEGTINWLKSVGYKLKGVYNNIDFEIEIIEYNNRYLKIMYNKNEFSIHCESLKKCKIGKILNEITGEFKIEKGAIIKDERRDLIIIDKEIKNITQKNGKQRTQKYYKYHCNKDGHEGWIIEHSLLKQKHGCQCCSGHVVVEGINDIPTTAPWLIPYFQGGYDEAKLYTKNGGGNPKNRGGFIYSICPECKRIKNKKIKIDNIYKTNSIKCNCSDGVSYPNKLAFNILEQLGIDFETEYSPKWISPKRYDFYFELNNNKYILEMDGGWHNKYNNLSGQTKEESKAIDDYKDEQARLYNIEVIRIDCNYIDMKIRFEYIKQNLLNDNILNKLFNLSNIDWIKAEEFALSNKIKKVCSLWENKINIKEITKIMKLDRHTISRYLIKGSVVGWCSYNQ